MNSVTKSQRNNYAGPSLWRIVSWCVVDRPGAHIHDHVASWRGRCTYCGHRVARWEGDKIILPIETRRQFWRIPSEIVHRFIAIRKGAR